MIHINSFPKTLNTAGIFHGGSLGQTSPRQISRFRRPATTVSKVLDAAAACAVRKVYAYCSVLACIRRLYARAARAQTSRAAITFWEACAQATGSAERARGTCRRGAWNSCICTR